MLALVLSLLGGWGAALADQIDDRFAAAADHYRHERWQQACDEFAALLADVPDGKHAAEAKFFFGEALVQRGQWNEARVQFGELLKSDPAGSRAREALFRSGEAAYMVGDDNAAKIDLHAFRERFPDDPLDAYVLPYLGSLELQAGNAEPAQQLFSQAVDRFKDGPLIAESEFGLAQALHQSDQLEAACKRYRAVIEAGSPLSEQALLQLATAENVLGNFPAALEALDQFAARFPDSSLASKGQLGRGYALFKLGRQAEAHDVLKAVAGEPAVSGEAAYWLALAQKAQGQWPAAAETLRGIDVDEQQPLAAAIGYHSGDALFHAGQLAAAQEAFDRVLARFGDSAWADDAQLGKLQVALGQKAYDETVRLADELTARFSTSPLVRQATLAKGQALATLEKPAEAVAALESLLKDDAASEVPDGEIRARAQATLAVCHAQLGHFDKSRQMLAALADAKTAGELATETTYHVAELALAFGDAALAQELFAGVAGGNGADEVARRAQSGLGWSHFKAQRWTEAAEAFGKLLETNPDGPLAAEAALLRGRSLEHLEQLEPALAMYRQVVEKYPASARAAEALWAGGRLYEQLGRTDEARANYAALVKGHPDFAELDAAIYQYASLLETTDAAAADQLHERLRSEFSDSPFAPNATLRLAERALAQENFADAEQLATAVRTPETPETVRRQALYLAGRLDLARGQWSAASGPLEQLIREFPDSELAQPSAYLIAEAEFRQEKYREAVDRLAALANQTQGRTDHWLAMGELRRAQALGHLRDWGEALTIARGISKRFPNFDAQHEIDYLIGRSLAAQADFAGAREAYAKVIESPGAFNTETAAMAQWMIGESYFHQDNYAAALAEYLKVDDRYPRWHAGALLQAGKCAEALERWPSAAELYERLLARYPDGDVSAEAKRRLGTAAERAAGRTATLK